jgi:hypothetical protein
MKLAKVDESGIQSYVIEITDREFYVVKITGTKFWNPQETENEMGRTSIC